jgi:lipid-binding SYLF domain-containing protein
VGGSVGTVGSGSAYVYAGDNPVMMTDPSGQYSILCNLTVAFFGFQVGLEFSGLILGIQGAALFAATLTSLATAALTIAAGPVGTGIGAALDVLFTLVIIGAFTYGVYEVLQTIAAGAGTIRSVCSRS